MSKHRSNIIFWSNLQLEKLVISSHATKINQIYLYEINYQSEPLLIQTPRMYLPFGVSKSYDQENKYQLNLSLFQLETFQQKISQLDKYFTTRYPDYQLVSSIRQNEDKFYPPYLRTKLSFPIQVYDVFGEPQTIDYLVPGSWTTNIIYLKHLWINEIDDLMGLSWYTLQTKVKTPTPILPPNRCLIDDDWQNETLCAICYSKVVRQTVVPGVIDNNNNSSLLSQDPEMPVEYEKYTKMLKLGIPLLAVIQRCQMDGRDPEILRQGHKFEVSSSSSLGNDRSPATIPPPPPTTTSTSQPARLLFTQQDLLQTRSKLGSNKVNPKTRKIKRLDIRRKDPRVPSLNMILESLNNLRPTKKPKDFASDEP